MTLTASIYDKMMKLRFQEASETYLGKLITLTSGDMAMIEHGSSQLQYRWSFVQILQLSVVFNLVSLPEWGLA